MPNDTVRANAQAMPVDRRAALGSLAAVAGALLAVPKIAKAGEIAGEPDPALAAIERHKAAAAAFAGFLSEVDDLPEWTPELEFEHRRLDDAERCAIFALAETTPTTRQGARAALAYLVREAGERHYRVLGIFAGRLISAKWPPGGEA